MSALSCTKKQSSPGISPTTKPNAGGPKTVQESDIVVPETLEDASDNPKPPADLPKEISKPIPKVDPKEGPIVKPSDPPENLQGSSRILWTKILGTEKSDGAKSVSILPKSDIFVAGYGDSSFLNKYKPSARLGAGQGALLVQFNSEGGLKRTLHLDKGEPSNAAGIAMGKDGNLYVVSTNSLSKISPDLQSSFWSHSCLRHSCLGLDVKDSARKVTVDPFGNIIVAGKSREKNSFGEFAGMFLSKFNSKGDHFKYRVLQRKKFSGNKEPEISGIATDNEGNIYIAGVAVGDLELQKAGTTGSDVFLMKLDGSLNTVWTKFLQEIDVNYLFKPALATIPGKLAVTGWNSHTYLYETSGKSLLTVPGLGGVALTFTKDKGFFILSSTLGSASITSNFQWDIVLRKLDAEGKLLWSETVATDNDEYPRGVHTDADGNTVVVGETEGEIAGQKHAGQRDLFVMKIQTN
jgi:hypothetical protein